MYELLVRGKKAFLGMKVFDEEKKKYYSLFEYSELNEYVLLQDIKDKNLFISLSISRIGGKFVKEGFKEKTIKEALEWGWNETESNNGYAIFEVNKYGYTLKQIQKIDDIDLFESDEEASIAAEVDGFNIIRDIEIFEGDLIGYYLDESENRKTLELLKNKL